MQIGIGIHPVHRRLAELTEKALRIGNWQQLPMQEQKEVEHCIRINAKIVRKHDELHQLLKIAYAMNDVEWQHDICRQIEQLEKSM
ncbi:hypothetical protein [Paenibacillus sp. GCM10027626]|uniref:DUF7667 family protein n=1 Tax=Paenibacillus sp. GCM10027626 TaxID=3273411 RepID=UPI0036257790